MTLLERTPTGIRATIDQGAWTIAGASTLFGLGLGTTMPAAQTMVQWAGGKAHLGIATATLSFARSIGGVMGTAATSAILLLVMERHAPGTTSRFRAALDMPAAGIAATAFPLNAIRDAFRWVFGAMAMIALVAALLAVRIPAIDLADPGLDHVLPGEHPGRHGTLEALFAQTTVDAFDDVVALAHLAQGRLRRLIQSPPAATNLMGSPIRSRRRADAKPDRSCPDARHGQTGCAPRPARRLLSDRPTPGWPAPAFPSGKAGHDRDSG
ncbi:hypothetical protein [Gluconacetobacter azotocaptans]